MKFLELFAGTRRMSDTFAAHGWETFTVEINEDFDRIDWHTDILNITAADILERFGKPDVIWLSPVCTTYSVAAISRHRRQEPNGNLAPISEAAKESDELIKHCLKLVDELNPTYYFIENPRGALRKMDFMQHIPIYTVTYCSYGDIRMKPTDIWCTHPAPNFKPICSNGNKSCHHQPAPRGSRTGTQGLGSAKLKAMIPVELCEHIATICDELKTSIPLEDNIPSHDIPFIYENVYTGENYTIFDYDLG